MNARNARNASNTPLAPPVRKFLPAALILMILGWGGLLAILLNASISGGTRWAFFFSAMLALTGTTLPVVAYLNRRFPTLPPPTTGVVVRQALWAGVYLTTLAWLQRGRVLTPALALLLAVGLLIIEGLLRVRERSQWKPQASQK